MAEEVLRQEITEQQAAAAAELRAQLLDVSSQLDTSVSQLNGDVLEARQAALAQASALEMQVGIMLLQGCMIML